MLGHFRDRVLDRCHQTHFAYGNLTEAQARELVQAVDKLVHAVDTVPLSDVPQRVYRDLPAGSWTMEQAHPNPEDDNSAFVQFRQLPNSDEGYAIARMAQFLLQQPYFSTLRYVRPTMSTTPTTPAHGTCGVYCTGRSSSLGILCTAV